MTPAQRVAAFLDAREALGHRSEIIGLVHRPATAPAELKLSDLRALIQAADAA